VEFIINICIYVPTLLLSLLNKKYEEKVTHLKIPAIIFFILIFMMIPNFPSDTTQTHRVLFEEYTDLNPNPSGIKRRATNVLQQQGKKRRYNTGKKRKIPHPDENISKQKKQKAGVITAKYPIGRHNPSPRNKNQKRARRLHTFPTNSKKLSP